MNNQVVIADSPGQMIDHNDVNIGLPSQVGTIAA